MDSINFLFVEKCVVGGILLSILIASIPLCRSLLSLPGIGIVSLGLAPWFALQDFVPSYLLAFRVGLLLAIPILISCELVSALSKSLEILRGSQLAEQLFVQERGGPIEFALFLLLGSLFLSGGGAELLLSQALQGLSSLDYVSHSEQSLNANYQSVLVKVFPLAALGLALELLSGLFQRVTKKNLFGAEFSNFRIPLAICFLTVLLDSAQ